MKQQKGNVSCKTNFRKICRKNQEGDLWCYEYETLQIEKKSNETSKRYYVPKAEPGVL